MHRLSESCIRVRDPHDPNSDISESSTELKLLWCRSQPARFSRSRMRKSKLVEWLPVAAEAAARTPAPHRDPPHNSAFSFKRGGRTGVERVVRPPELNGYETRDACHCLIACGVQIRCTRQRQAIQRLEFRIHLILVSTMTRNRKGDSWEAGPGAEGGLGGASGGGGPEPSVERRGDWGPEPSDERGGRAARRRKDSDERRSEAPRGWAAPR